MGNSGHSGGFRAWSRRGISWLLSWGELRYSQLKPVSMILSPQPSRVHAAASPPTATARDVLPDFLIDLNAGT